MNKNKIYDQLLQMLAPLCAARDLEIWGIELLFGAGGRHKIVRIYLDAPAGVSIDQCADISRHLSLALDVDDIIPGAFTLEVSSPGLERPFFTLEQMRPYLGHEIRVRLSTSLEGRKNFKGRLLAIEDSTLALDIDAATYVLNWADVTKANLIYDPQTSGKVGKQ